MTKAHHTIIISILLAILVTSTAMANPSLDLGTASGSQCAQVTISVTLTNDGIAPVAGVATDIGYNSEFLTPVSVAAGPAGTAAGKSASANIVSPGLYRVGIFSSGNVNNIGNGVVANVIFAINCSAPATSYQLSNTPSASTATGGAIDATGNNGAITVTVLSTTTTSVIQEPVPHIQTCITCHPSSSLHNVVAHTNNMSDINLCSNCHAGAPGAGNVQPDKCVICHPGSSPGVCNLINLPSPVLHGANCLTCHVDCDDNTTNNHMSSCVACHPTDFSSTNSLRIHGRSGHSSCSSCHPNGTPGKNVTADKCTVCHPLSGTGDCKLVDEHAQLATRSCLDCHESCSGGAPITTTTSTISDATTSTGGGSTTTTIAGGSTTTSPPTSTVLPNTHMGNCLSCHFENDLHARSAHSDCTKCHAGTPQKGNVQADQCVACHPVGKAGECNLINLHDNSCRTCHTTAMCPSGASTTTTTSTSGSSSSTTTAPTTTSVTAEGHTGICLTCHFVSDLHGRSAHNNCSYCHTGTPQTNNVDADKCIMCHPIAAPGKCSLVDIHGGSCRTCHAVCTESSTTTTSTGPATTTTPSTYGHIADCLVCHKVSDLHARSGHGTCTQCHDGTPQAGNVSPGKCVICHPLGSAGKCNLINIHGSSCVACHTTCSGGVTSTSTIPNPPPPCTVTADPGSVRSGFFIPLFNLIKIQTLTGGFDETSTVSIQGFRFISITRVTSAELTVLVVVPPQYLTGLGDKIVNVITGEQICTGTITLK